jgi:hypothetical protein
MPMIERALLSGTPYKIPPDAIGQPVTATIRMLDFAIVPSQQLGKPDKLEFFFSAANFSVDVAAYGGIGGLIDAVRTDPDFPYPDPVTLVPPYTNKLSLQNDENCYVVYRLTDSKNWQFAHKKAPFSVGEKGNEASVYSGVRRVDADGNVDDGADPNDKRYGCKIAYFIADGARAAANQPGGYVHEFNIHVDLIVEDDAGQPSYMPIDIDPDVRYPGGSGVDGGGG